MELQEILNNAVQNIKQERLKTSPQWTLGELIVALESVQDKSLRVFLDSMEIPTHFISWRGSYDELVIEFDKTSSPLSVKEFLVKAKNALSETFFGYKGGEFTMGRRTPLWVDHCEEGSHRGVIGLETKEDKVLIMTDECEF